MIIGSTEVTHKLTELVNWFNEKYGFAIKGLDFHHKTVASRKEIYPFAYAAWCNLAIIKSLEPSSVFSPGFAPSNEISRFWEHLYRHEFLNEEKSAETTRFNDLVFQPDRPRISTSPKFFSTPSLLDELIPHVTVEVGEQAFSFWFKKQLCVESNFADPNQKSLYPEIQIRPVEVSAWCKVLPDEWDESEIIFGNEKVQTKGLGKSFPSPDMYFGGYLGRKPVVVFCKPKTETIKLSVREEIREIVQMIGYSRILLVTEHESWRKFFISSIKLPTENICIDNKWNARKIKEFVEQHKKMLEA